MQKQVRPIAPDAPFYAEPFIQRIATNPKWAVSDSNKRPVVAQSLKFGIAQGVHANDPEEMTNLASVRAWVSPLPNAAYFMDGLCDPKDGFILIDIEPVVWDSAQGKKLVNAWLQQPYIYGERSMSGRGIHLVFPVTPAITKALGQRAKSLTRIQRKDRFLEIMLNHWVTFTGNLLRTPHRFDINDPDAGCYDDTGVVALIEQSVAQANTAKVLPKSLRMLADNISDSCDGIPDVETIITLLMRQPFKRKLTDYNNDHSRYEAAAIMSIIGRLGSILHLSAIRANHHYYTQSECAAIIKTLFNHIVPYREKHDAIRGEHTWLDVQIFKAMAIRYDHLFKFTDEAVVVADNDTNNTEKE